MLIVPIHSPLYTAPVAPRSIWVYVGLGLLSLVAPSVVMLCYLAVAGRDRPPSWDFPALGMALLAGLICLLRIPMPIALKYLSGLVYTVLMGGCLIYLSLMFVCVQFHACL